MTKKYLLFAVALLLTLPSCYRESDMDGYRDEEIENMLTLNSLVNPDSTVSVSATRTYFFSDVHTERAFVPGLEIELWIDGEKRENLTCNSAVGLYESAVRPAEGETVELRTNFKGKEVTASDVVPVAPVIEEIAMERQGPMYIYFENDYLFTYRITFSDTPGKENYYFLQYDSAERRYDLPMGNRDFTYEYVFRRLADEVNGTLPGWEPYSPYGLPFSDRGIDGTRHTLVVKETIQSSIGVDFSRYGQMKREFRLYSISKAYYDYLVSILYNSTDDSGIHGGMIDLGIADPMKVYSNVAGGVGILAGYSLDSRVVDVLEVVGPFPD